MTTVAVILAAGAGTRFEGPEHKLNAAFRGGTVARAAVAAAREARAAGAVDRVRVVVGATELRGVNLDDVEIVTNTNWAQGQATSLAAALASIDDPAHEPVDAVVVALADQPLIAPSAWCRVAASHSPIAVASYEDGRVGHPIRLHRSVWSLLPTTGDSGARDLIRLRPDLVSQVACEGSNADIDTQEDLRTWT